jgi:hypothetical protein
MVMSKSGTGSKLSRDWNVGLGCFLLYSRGASERIAEAKNDANGNGLKEQRKA